MLSLIKLKFYKIIIFCKLIYSHDCINTPICNPKMLINPHRYNVLCFILK